jgi:hypothetical protein
VIHDLRSRQRPSRPAHESLDSPRAVTLGVAVWLGLFGLALYLIFR